MLFAHSSASTIFPRCLRNAGSSNAVICASAVTPGGFAFTGARISFAKYHTVNMNRSRIAGITRCNPNSDEKITTRPAFGAIVTRPRGKGYNASAPPSLASHQSSSKYAHIVTRLESKLASLSKCSGKHPPAPSFTCSFVDVLSSAPPPSAPNASFSASITDVAFASSFTNGALAASSFDNRCTSHSYTCGFASATTPSRANSDAFATNAPRRRSALNSSFSARARATSKASSKTT